MNIPKKIAQILINSLKGGVVPRIGLPYITVGRKAEIEALLKDVEMIEDGGASFRFITGSFGSGKSFLLQTIRNYAMAKDFVVVDADLSPERRLHGTKGQGLATYRELIRNMAAKFRPEGGALQQILDRWIDAVRMDAMEQDEGYADRTVRAAVYQLNDMVGGFDFGWLIMKYYRAYMAGDDEVSAKVLKWLRGEYPTRAEARADLGINAVITDDNWYDHLKVFAMFLKYIGYAGMMILLDELVNIYKIPNSITRQYNYEKILTMYNDAMQGKASYLGVIMCGTPQSMEDPRRGVYSYEALRSRLAKGHFSGEHKDLLAPVIHLIPLTYEEMLILVEKLADIHAQLYGYDQIVTAEDMIDFIKTEFGRIGADSHITPREVTRDFIEVLDIVYQEPETSVAQLLGSDRFHYAVGELEEGASEGEFAEFDL